MNILNFITDNVLYFLGGLLLLLLIIKIIEKRIQPEPDPVLEAFFMKYNIDLDNPVATDRKLEEIANINSTFPDQDKKIAQALVRFHHEIRRSIN